MPSTVQHDETDAPEVRASRRQVVVGAGSICLLGLGLAACSGDSDGDDAASSPSGSAAAGGGEGSAGTTVVALDKIEVGGAVSAQVGGEDAIVARPKEDAVVAFNATCPHQGGKVAPEGDQLVCPLHGSTFNALTGEVTKGPAAKGLTEIEVVIDGQNVVTA